MNEKLLKIQSELIAPKKNYNKFGGYNYRSAEDILDAVKPLCEKYNVVLLVNDDLVLIGDRYYIKSIAKLIDVETSKSIESQAFAREPESKKGMDESQITGAASSYARKYALNGLFCIDDVKDADTMDNNDKKIDYDSVAKKCESIDGLENLTRYYKEITSETSKTQQEELKKIFAKRRTEIENKIKEFTK